MADRSMLENPAAQAALAALAESRRQAENSEPAPLQERQGISPRAARMLQRASDLGAEAGTVRALKLTRFHIAEARRTAADTFGPLQRDTAIMAAPGVSRAWMQQQLQERANVVAPEYEIKYYSGAYQLIMLTDEGNILHTAYPTPLDAENGAWWKGLIGGVAPEGIRAGGLPEEEQC